MKRCWKPTLIERSQAQKTTYCMSPPTEMSSTDKFIEKENGLVVAKGWKEKGMENDC